VIELQELTTLERLSLVENALKDGEPEKALGLTIDLRERLDENDEIPAF
jgi:hypothetical protein